MSADSDEYVPSVDSLRNGYGWSCHDNWLAANRDEAMAAFDRALAAHDAALTDKAKADAWDEGYTQSELDDYNTGHRLSERLRGNPYRTLTTSPQPTTETTGASA